MMPTYLSPPIENVRDVKNSLIVLYLEEEYQESSVPPGRKYVQYTSPEKSGPAFRIVMLPQNSYARFENDWNGFVRYEHLMSIDLQSFAFLSKGIIVKAVEFDERNFRQMAYGWDFISEIGHNIAISVKCRFPKKKLTLRERFLKLFR